MFCASVSHATSPRNIHATTREVTSTAWLKIPRDKCLGFDASETCPIDLRILRRVLSRLFRLIMYPGVDERGLHGYGYGKKERLFS